MIELRWIRGFLTDRKQAVVVGGNRSKYSPVTSGVPQRSVLGPVLFLMYINDIGLLTNSTVKLFADDCLIYRVIKSASDVKILQEDLDQLIRWASDWQMAFNVTKCHVMRITNARKKIVDGDYFMGRERVEWTKLLP